MAITLTLPNEYGLVLAAATSTFFAGILYTSRTVKFRSASKTPYPAAYATPEAAASNPLAHKFNCAQRAHANFTENLTPLLGALLISGLEFPVLSAALGGLWTVARVGYLYGYTSDAGPKGRSLGALGSFAADTVLKLLAAYTSYVIATGSRSQ